ncbi:hypothetical protein ACWEOZ_39480 [Actinoplanes sp. NPDC004185]
MATDTFLVHVGVYPSVALADDDYELVRDLFTEVDVVDAYDAAVVERRPDGKAASVQRYETPTRAGGVLGGGLGLATGLVVPAQLEQDVAAAGVGMA